MKRCCVLVPPFSDFYSSPRRWSSLGARTVCRMLEQQGLRVDFIDAVAVRPKGRQLPFPQELSHLSGLIIPDEYGPTAFFSGFRRFGLDPAAAAAAVAATAPDIVFFSQFAWCYAQDLLDTARELRRLLPEVSFFAGGAGVSVYPAFFLRSGFFDGVFCGEAETALEGFAGRLQGGPQPPGLLTDPEQSAGPPAGSGPVDPAAAAVYRSRRGTKISVSLTRGCAAACRFCSNRLTHGRRFRTAPLELLAKRLERLETCGAVSINFEDDNLLLDREYFHAAVDLCRKKFPDAEFTAENGLDYRLLDADEVKFLHKSGFRAVNLSLGTVSPGAAHLQQRRVDTERFVQVLELLQQVSLPVISYFICGMDGDTPQDTLANLHFLHDKPTLIGISPFYAVPGLPGYPPGDPRFAAPGCSRGSALYPWSGTHSTAQLMTAFRLARLINLAKAQPQEGLFRELLVRSVRDSRVYTLRRSRPGMITPVDGLDQQMIAAVTVFMKEYIKKKSSPLRL